MTDQPIRVIHFVTGGGSGATRVALDLALDQHRTPGWEPWLVLRRKPQALPPAMQAQIDESRLRVVWIADRWPKFLTVRQLVQTCREIRPHAFLAHGYSEHLWGRQAACQAQVPVIVHVEHNLERYSWWRRGTARHLAEQTTATVSVSHGVAERLQQLGLAARRAIVIHNGIDLGRFGGVVPPLAERPPDIVMAARFARQKDQATLIRAVRRLADAGWTGQLFLAGGGKASCRRNCEQLARNLNLTQVKFLGPVADMPALLRRCRAAVLSTRFEGFGLALAEGMASGCASLASRVPGVTDVLCDGETGWFFSLGDDAELAAILQRALDPTQAQEITDRGLRFAREHFSQSRMASDYRRLIEELVGEIAK